MKLIITNHLLIVYYQAGNAEGKDKIAFRISSGKLRENITQKTSMTKVWGAVPFRAGLEGNVFERRGLELAESDEERLEQSPRLPRYDHQIILSLVILN